MEELLRKLDINKRGEFKGGVYTIDLDSFNEFSSMYNKLEHNDECKKDSDESYFNIDEAHITYFLDDYDINLTADLDSDVYVLIIEEVKEQEVD